MVPFQMLLTLVAPSLPGTTFNVKVIEEEMCKQASLENLGQLLWQSTGMNQV